MVKKVNKDSLQKVKFPKGFKIMPLSDFGETCKFSDDNDTLQGVIVGYSTYEQKNDERVKDKKTGKMKTHTTIKEIGTMQVKDAAGKIYNVFESTKLKPLFDEDTRPEIGKGIYIKYLGTVAGKKKGFKPMKDFEVAIEE